MMCRNQAAYRIILGWCKLNTYGRHGRAHVVGVGDALVNDLPGRHMRHIRTAALGGENTAAARRCRPLRGGGAL